VTGPANSIRLFLSGDVMTGRGIDQILPHPSPPELYESWVRSAAHYVALAEAAHGPIPSGVPLDYIWGEALAELARAKPDVRIVNLETSITLSEDYLPKGINYRMSPENAECLRAAALDCCILANNHVLDWGRSGLLETLATLERLNIRAVGAGRNLAEARAPAVFDQHEAGRLIVFAMACTDSGVPSDWAATDTAPGVNLVSDFDDNAVGQLKRQIKEMRRDGDIIAVSIHWGANWGYQVAGAYRRFAHALIDEAAVSLVHGHSSHHPKPIEVYKDRLILYGCGDFINDYEGITGYEEYRGDLALMYFADFVPKTGTLRALEMVPLQITRFQLMHASDADAEWLCCALDRECRPFGGGVVSGGTGRLMLRWRA
jgi:poly-gamma-glutamate capsule biosynthesis protein CapA/YwtB (metallophosphatase superfamily)